MLGKPLQLPDVCFFSEFDLIKSLPRKRLKERISAFDFAVMLGLNLLILISNAGLAGD